MFPPKPINQPMPFHTTPQPNPVAEAMNKKKKKYNAGPASSLMGLKKAAMGPSTSQQQIPSPGGFSGG